MGDVDGGDAREMGMGMGGHASRWPWALETMRGLNPVSDSAFTSALFFTCDATR